MKYKVLTRTNGTHTNLAFPELQDRDVSCGTTLGKSLGVGIGGVGYATDVIPLERRYERNSSKSPSPKRATTTNESKIKKFFLFLFDLYPVFAAALGISLQREKIAYPKDAINADITFAEFTKQLDRNGFRCNLLLLLFTLLDKKELKKKVKEEFTKSGGLNALMNSSDRWSFSKLVAWFLLRKAMPVILDYRNEMAVAKVQAYSNGRNIFIHYGEKHVKDLVSLLRRDGWVVKETTYTALAELC